MKPAISVEMAGEQQYKNETNTYMIPKRCYAHSH